MSLRSPLGRVRGLGSAKEGTRHWWMQRVTAVALIPLSLWLVFSLPSLIRVDYTIAVNWIGHPWNSTLLILLLFCLFYHAILGLQVVIEDYIHHEGRKIAALLTVKFALTLLGAASVIAVLRVMFLSLLPQGG